MKYFATKLKDTLFVYPKKSIKDIITVTDYGNFGIYIFNNSVKQYFYTTASELLLCDESYITQNISLCVSSSSTSK